MRNLLFLLIFIALTSACNMNRVEILHYDASQPGVTSPARWSQITFLATVPQFDYGEDVETLDIFPGLRLDATHFLVSGVYPHKPRLSLMSLKDIHGKGEVRAKVHTQHIGEKYSIIETTKTLQGPLPTYGKRHLRVGEDVHVGPYKARIYSERLHGERFRRYQVVFPRDVPMYSTDISQCTPGLPVMDAKNNVIGVMIDFYESADTFPPLGFGHATCEIMTVSEFKKSLAVFGITLG